MKIGIDLDEILSQSTLAFIKFHNEIYGTNIKIENKKTYSWSELINESGDVYEKKIHEFFTSSYGKNIKPIKDARNVLEKLKSNNRLYIITARSNNVRKETEEWIEKHYYNIFSNIYFTDQWFKNGIETTKGTICNILGIDIFIEDNLEYALECVAPNRIVYLLDYPWNQTDKLPKGVRRVYSWKEIGESV